MLSRWEPSRIRRAVAVTVPAAVMLGLALWGIDRGGIWRDEAVTFQVARRPVPDIWRLLHAVDAVHGLYYLFMHAVLAVRADEVLLRLPSACAAAVTAALVAALGTKLARPRVGLWAGLLYAVTPMAGHYAQEGRSYAMVAAGATGATLVLVRAVTAGGRTWWAYGGLVGVTCWLHEFAVLLLLAHAVTLALARMPWPVWWRWASASGAAVLTLVPLVLVSRTQSAQLAWVREPDSDSAEWLAREFFGQSDGVYWTCLALAALGAARALGRRGELTAAGVALPLLLVPPAALMAASLATPLYVDRYVLYALAGAPLLTALGAERLTRPVRRRPAGRGRTVPDGPPAGANRLPSSRPPRPAGARLTAAVPGARDDAPTSRAAGHDGARLSRAAGPRPHRTSPRTGSRVPPDPHHPPAGPGGVPGAASSVSGPGGGGFVRVRGALGRWSRGWLRRVAVRRGTSRGGSPAGPRRLPGLLPLVAALGALRAEGPTGAAEPTGRRPRRLPRSPVGHGPRRSGAPAQRSRPHSGTPVPRRPRGPGSPLRSLLVTAAGVLAVAVVLALRLPVLRADRLAATRPDDLAAIAALAARDLRPGDPVLFLPAQVRGTALAYPAGFRGTRDVALAGPAAASGTLYGREVGERALRTRLAGLRRVWVLAERRVLDAPGYPGDPAERAKLTVVDEQFTLRAESVQGPVALRLYERRRTGANRTPGSPAAPPRPVPW